MEKLSFEYSGTKPISKRVHVGVVGSGDLEILMEPLKEKYTQVTIRTRFEGNSELWKALLDRFFASNDIIAKVEINDFGGTPGVATMRLLQALEVSNSVSNKK